MKKIIAVALLAVPFTFAAQTPATNAPADSTAKTTTKKHVKKSKKSTKADAAAPTTQAAPTAKTTK